MKHISLFSGVGMTELGMKLVLPIKTVLYCENDEYCQKVLKARMADGALDTAPIHDDVTTLNPADYGVAECDIISGGFPCQDISCAGKGEGLKGKRSGLFYEIMRIAGDLRPQYILLENVSALLVRGMDAVLGALSEAGYDAVWTSIRASDVGAPHRRERVFILAYDNRNISGTSGTDQNQATSTDVSQRRSTQGTELANSQGDRMEGLRPEGEQVAEVSAGQEISGRDSMRNELWPLGYGPDQHDWEPPRLVAKSKQPRSSSKQPEQSHKKCFTDTASASDRGSGQKEEGWPTQSGVGLLLDERPDRLDESIGDNNAEISNKAGACEALRAVWEAAGAQEVQWSAGRQVCFLAEEILQSGMRLDWFTRRICFLVWAAKSGYPVSGFGLCGMRHDKKHRHPSHQQQSGRQLQRECAYAMRQLSYEMALGTRQIDAQTIPDDMLGLRQIMQDARRNVSEALRSMEEVWRSTLDEDQDWAAFISACDNIRMKAKNTRVNELRALGNGIVVPQLAAALIELFEANLDIPDK